VVAAAAGGERERWNSDQNDQEKRSHALHEG
jgi:hypothetical protein